MEAIFERVAGLDVHKKTVVACVRIKAGSGVTKELRSFGTMTPDIIELRDWLAGNGVTQVAMESTGVYWRPIYNLLEEHFELLVVNARHLKFVPGRKTDMKDAEWIAQVMMCGLLRPSFVPNRRLRELRELTRDRASLIQEQTRVANRLHKVLEVANIKLASVATDVFGVSGRLMIEAMIAGESNPETMADLAKLQLRKKIPELRSALQGRLTDHTRRMLKFHYEHYLDLERRIDALSQCIKEYDEIPITERGELRTPATSNDQGEEDGGEPSSFGEAVALIATIPGVGQTCAQNLIAEIGSDMSQFPTDGHLASWMGVCPGNNESAGKRKSGRTKRGNPWAKRSLTQAAWAAARTKQTYLNARFARLCRRRGKKRAQVALAHALVRIIFHMLKRGTAYQDLGGEYYDRLNHDRVARYYIRRLQDLGYAVAKVEQESPS